MRRAVVTSAAVAALTFGLVGTTHAVASNSEPPDSSDSSDSTVLPDCADVFADRGSPTEEDYERGCVITFERYECANDDSVRYMSPLGTGRVDGNFFLHVDPQVIRDFCEREDDGRGEALANFILSMCLIGATYDDAMEMARRSDSNFTTNELAIIASQLPLMLSLDECG